MMTEVVRAKWRKVRSGIGGSPARGTGPPGRRSSIGGAVALWPGLLETEGVGWVGTWRARSVEPCVGMFGGKGSAWKAAAGEPPRSDGLEDGAGMEGPPPGDRASGPEVLRKNPPAEWGGCRLIRRAAFGCTVVRVGTGWFLFPQYLR
jgi:hypothetical protein